MSKLFLVLHRTKTPGLIESTYFPTQPSVGGVDQEAQN